ncbi:MAG: imidazole glycerol phosphate synthase subunit HisH [Promethearchaeota archaeon]|nr:MAG: imidazole glycerol phosphate synthase subunit HisH [Candidatus Lokiarchaeota archaeon]
MGFYIAIIDYEMGNLKSVYKCIKHLGADSIITDDPNEILNADGIILPGVGSFKDAMKYLSKKNLISVINKIIDRKIPLFGICLGLQLLYSKSYEMGEFEGLDIISGKVVKFDINKVDKIPQIGWNNVDFQKTDHYLIQDIPDGAYFYFVHSYYGIPRNKENVLGLTKYGETEFCSMIQNNNVVATQFHPEKSSKYGIQMYRNFILHCKK